MQYFITVKIRKHYSTHFGRYCVLSTNHRESIYFAIKLFRPIRTRVKFTVVMLCRQGHVIRSWRSWIWVRVRKTHPTIIQLLYKLSFDLLLHVVFILWKAVLTCLNLEFRSSLMVLRVWSMNVVHNANLIFRLSRHQVPIKFASKTVRKLLAPFVPFGSLYDIDRPYLTPALAQTFGRKEQNKVGNRD